MVGKDATGYVCSRRVLLIPSCCSLSLETLLSGGFARGKLQMGEALATAGTMTLTGFTNVRCSGAITVIVIREGCVSLTVLAVKSKIFRIGFAVNKRASNVSSGSGVFSIYATCLGGQNSVRSFRKVSRYVVISRGAISGDYVDIVRRAFRAGSVLSANLAALFGGNVLIRGKVLSKAMGSMLLLSVVPCPVNTRDKKRSVVRVVSGGVCPACGRQLVNVPSSKVIYVARKCTRGGVAVKQLFFRISSVRDGLDEVGLGVSVSTGNLLGADSTVLARQRIHS